MLKGSPIRPYGTASDALAREARKDLVNALSTSTGTLAACALASGAVTVAIAAQAGLWPLTLAAAVVVVVGAGRLALDLAYRTPQHSDEDESPRWEGAYRVLSVSYSAAVGLFALMTLLMVRDPRLHLLATAMSFGFATGIAGRAVGRRSIVVVQLVLATLPVALGLLLTANGLYRLLGLATLLVLAGMIDGTLQTYKAVLRAFKTARETEGLIADVQLKAKEACAASEAKTRFLANMSHEIRTPLNGMLGMTDVMWGDSLIDQQRARLRVIRQSGGALMALLNDILDLSKVEAGKLEIESAPFHLGDLLKSVAATFEESAAKRGVVLRIVASSSDLGVYEGDEARLRQILFNLISNGLKFTEAGLIEVRVAFTGGALDLAIRDTGMGIAPEHLQRLFQRFSQADASTNRRFGGTGLGLAICQELTTLLRGRIWAESSLGEGSTFFVSIPIVQIAAAEVADARAPSPPTAATKPDCAEAVAVSAAVRRPAAVAADNDCAIPTAVPARKELKVRLLCAEDNEVNQMVLRALLEPYNYDLTVVDDGLQALEAYKAEGFDLILLDIQMPVMDGPTAAVAIRLFEKQTSRPAVPIIALTANVMADQVQSYLAAGMDQVIPKPIDIDDLYAAIQHYLSRSSWLDGGALPDSISSPIAGFG
jgi:signal transduction histidine kinase/CheY-like chemotaxis protein